MTNKEILTLYQKIDSKLEKLAGEGEIYLAGKTIDYGALRFDPWILEESVDFFVSRLPETGFNQKKLNTFLDSLRLENEKSILVEAHTEQLLLADGGSGSRLSFGCVMFYESLGSYFSFINKDWNQMEKLILQWIG